MTLRRLAAAALLATLPAAARAERIWMLPAQTTFAGTNSWLTMDAAVSDELFTFEHAAFRLDPVKVWAPDGSPGAYQNGATGHYRSSFDVKLDKPGTWKIGFTQTNVGGTFKVNGKERRVGGRGPGGPGPGGPGGGRPGGEGGRPGGAGGPGEGGRAFAPPVALADIPADATDVKLAETVSRNEVFVTVDAPTRTVLAPTGKGLELDPVTHPDELVAGETARFRFLIDGKPAPGLRVVVVPGGKRYRDADNALELKTGADGTIAVTWPAAGLYWLNATATDAHPSEPRATERRMSYATTLEVLTP